jgi:hypothetical protein
MKRQMARAERIGVAARLSFGVVEGLTFPWISLSNRQRLGDRYEYPGDVDSEPLTEAFV